MGANLLSTKHCAPCWESGLASCRSKILIVLISHTCTACNVTHTHTFTTTRSTVNTFHTRVRVCVCVHVCVCVFDLLVLNTKFHCKSFHLKLPLTTGGTLRPRCLVTVHGHSTRSILHTRPGYTLYCDRFSNWFFNEAVRNVFYRTSVYTYPINCLRFLPEVGFCLLWTTWCLKEMFLPSYTIK